MKGLRRLGMIRMNAMEFWMRIVDGDESEEVIRVRKVMRKQWVHLINSKQVTCWNWWDRRRNENMRWRVFKTTSESPETCRGYSRNDREWSFRWMNAS